MIDLEDILLIKSIRFRKINIEWCNSYLNQKFYFIKQNKKVVENGEVSDPYYVLSYKEKV